MSEFGVARNALSAITAAERENPNIDPGSGTRWWFHDRPTERVVVLLHGFTNNPRQWTEFAPQLHADGYNVIVPRLPLHGYRDRMTTALARLTREELQASALAAVAIAANAGRFVDVVGISVGGTLAAWLATCVAIQSAVAVAPFFGIKHLSGTASDALASALEALPNVFVWWDPIRRADQLPVHGYPRFPTKALGQSLALSRAVDSRVGPGAALSARRLVLVLNDKDPVVSNAVSQHRAEALRGRITEIDIILRDDLPAQHDIIEPTLPSAPTGTVYPLLRSVLARRA